MTNDQEITQLTDYLSVNYPDIRRVDVRRALEKYDKEFGRQAQNQPENQIKQLLGIDISSPLPLNWDKQLAKKSDLEQIQRELQMKLKILTANYQTFQREVRGLINPQESQPDQEDLKKIEAIAKKFSEERLEKTLIDLYFYHPQNSQKQKKNYEEEKESSFLKNNSGALGYTEWKTKTNLDTKKEEKDYSGFQLHLRIDRPRAKVFQTLAHELAHDIVLLKEKQGKLKPCQGHSKAFWENYLDWDSTFQFVLNNLEGKKREELRQLFNPSTYKVKDEEKVTKVAYFPIRAKNEIKKWKYMTYLSKVISNPEAVDEEWELTRREVLRLADKEINNHPAEQAVAKWKLVEKGGQDIQTKKRWLQIEVRPKGEEDKHSTEDEEDKYKIYVYYDQESPIKDRLRSELCERRGFKEKETVIDLDKRKRLDESVDRGRQCGYLAQIQVDPKSN